MFENEHYLAVGKRRGWPLQSPRADRPSLMAAVASFLKHRAHGAEPRLTLLRGLDAAGSGVVLFATSAAADRELRASTSLLDATCAGGPETDTGELTGFLRKQRRGRREVLVEVRAGGKKAITRYRVIERRAGLCHLELEPILGPTHHVRAQLALAGWPIVGDPLYGDAKATTSGMLLHTRRLSFADASGVRITIEAPLPDDFFAPPPSAGARRYLLFYKPYGVLCQFTTTSPGERCLADYPFPAGVYPVGRLDKDSEGLLLLTDDGAANARLSDPAYAKEKCYWVHVEGIPTDTALASLAAGVVIRGYTTRPCQARRLEPAPTVPERDPPIRFRRDIPTCWLEIILTEGKNRQVRRMTAAIGHPTLRLVRARIDRFSLGALRPGELATVASL
ncbi:MAG TPA: pseudouridine synthase [Kofleriaceae bacterium]|nr:pseudouridine synthase [Kofleriaceae bacterium]